ncbi:hypothetical protein GGQ85_002381 [Nitrobacter vulgaris]|nr:hypothetical protein [Nitrobacter vulgaris]
MDKAADNGHRKDARTLIERVAVVWTDVTLDDVIRHQWLNAKAIREHAWVLLQLRTEVAASLRRKITNSLRLMVEMILGPNSARARFKTHSSSFHDFFRGLAYSSK